MQSLTGKLLIAMPGMGDPRFEKSVVFLCEHSSGGAMGLIVNKLTPEIEVKGLLKHLGIEPGEGAERLAVHFGGPVESSRGFVLHSSDYTGSEGTLLVTDDVAMTASLEILSEISSGRGPRDVVLALGYSGWGPGQLETEIQDNGWLIADGPSEIVFHRNVGAKWEAALQSMGIDPLALSATAGRA